MRSPFRVIHDRPVTLTIRFDKQIAGYIREKIWHHTQRIEPQKDSSIIFSTEVAGTDEVKHWVHGWGKPAEVLEPEFLREEVARELKECLARYGPLVRDQKQV